MNKMEAIAFLMQHQPLPSDQHLTRGTIEAYDEARKYFLANKDSKCIPLFLGSFGVGSGFGVYQLIEPLLLQYTPEEVLPHLKEKLSSKHYGVRYWCAQIAAAFPDESLVNPLAAVLTDTNADARIMAAIALGAIGGPSARVLLNKAVRKERDQDVIQAIEEAIEEMDE